ncbi:MAG: bisphosphoglycerate-dependent phosphoglycerate mutase [Bacillariaceae sp.]|jgi:bisphosphoglycerate-dependent phosphoglycerate mutase
MYCIHSGCFIQIHPTCNPPRRSYLYYRHRNRYRHQHRRIRPTNNLYDNTQRTVPYLKNFIYTTHNNSMVKVVPELANMKM